MGKKFALFLIVLIGFLSLNQHASAQNEDILILPTIVSQEIDPAKMAALQNTYFLLLEQYRSQEQKYIVAKNQYLQLNTLASQEVAVKETRTLLSLRADILTVYTDILDELLSESKGIRIENKNPERVNLSLLKEKIKIHKSKVESAQDRFSIDQESVSFQPTFLELQAHTYYTLSLIKIGYSQIAFDKLVTTRDAIEIYTNQLPLSAAKKSEKKRGFEEIQRTMLGIDSTFSPVKTEVYSNPGNGSLANYSQLSQKLNPVFAQINQVIQFLEEIRKP